MMPQSWGTTIAYTRAELRQLKPGRGPARVAPVRVCHGAAAPGKMPARAANGRYLYVPSAPLPPQSPRRRPAPLARTREVG
jgi:hypothetical protein